MKYQTSEPEKKFIPVLVILSVIFVIIGYIAKDYSFFGLDMKISQYIQMFTDPAFYYTMLLVSSLGDSLGIELLIGVSILVLSYVGWKKEALLTFAGASLGALVGSLIKDLVNRARPDTTQVDIYKNFSDKSYPSMHVLVYTIFFGYMLYLAIYKVKSFWLKTLIILVSLFLLLTIGLSRIYLGAHWASDTLGGYTLGFAFLLIIITINRKFTK